MPQRGESVHEGTIAKWLVKPGEQLVEFEPMMEVETDKVATEVPSPVTGILKEILAADGTTVASGGEIAVVEVESGDGAAPKAAAPEPTSPAARPEPAPAAEPAAATGSGGDRLGSGGPPVPPAAPLPAGEEQLHLESTSR